MTEQETNTCGVEASDPEGASPPIWLAPLGASLLVGGGGLILIDGLPVGVSILDNSSARSITSSARDPVAAT